MKYCVLYDKKECTNCGECDRCDLNPDKICDNCCACLEKNDDEEQEQAFARIQVADIITEQQEDYLNTYFAEEDEEEEGAERELPPYERPDPALLEEWERRLREDS